VTNKSNNKSKECVSFFDSDDTTEIKVVISYSKEISEQFSSNSDGVVLEINVFEEEIRLLNFYLGIFFNIKINYYLL
jgi:hypothetical protein